MKPASKQTGKQGVKGKSSTVSKQKHGLSKNVDKSSDDKSNHSVLEKEKKEEKALPAGLIKESFKKIVVSSHPAPLRLEPEKLAT